MYTDCKLRTVTVEGTSKTDKALALWTQMTWEQRYEVMSKVKPYKTIERRFRACINYVSDNMIEE